jgi:hypothetical protein
MHASAEVKSFSFRMPKAMLCNQLRSNGTSCSGLVLQKTRIICILHVVWLLNHMYGLLAELPNRMYTTVAVCSCSKIQCALLLFSVNHIITRGRNPFWIFAGGMESTTGYCPPVWDLLLALA